MRLQVIIFDGRFDQYIGTDYFFQHPLISTITKDNIKRFYIENMSRLDAATGLMDDDYIFKLKNGCDILEVMLKDLLGDDVATELINNINEIVKGDTK